MSDIYMEGWMWGTIAAVVWVLGMQLLRMRRSVYIAGKKDVEYIYKLLFSVEFPFVWLKGLELALFNTFAYQPVYARLSVNKKFTEAPELRYDDTELLLREAWEHGVNSERGCRAMNRLNTIHSHFNIDNRSYLYVLAMFVVAPVRLINEYEFRTLTEHEIKCACNAITLMGRAMGITDLPISYADYEKIVDDEYASDKMRVDPRGKAIANSVLAMFLRPAPAFIHPFARRIVYALLDDPVRRALDYPKQPRILRHFAKALLLTRAYIIKWMFPTRPLSWAILRTPKVPGGAPRFQKYRKAGCPFAYPDEYDCGRLGTWTHANAGRPIT